MERDAAKALPNDQLLEILSTAPASTVAKLTEQLTYVNEKVAAFKTEINSTKMIETLEKSLAGAKKIWQ
jgi:simple sugar transport system permease protein